MSKAPLLHRCHRHPAHTPPLQDIGGVQRADGRAVVANGTPEPAGDKDRRSLRQRCCAETRERLGYAPQPPEFWHRELPEDTCRAHTIVLAISAARSLPTHTEITHGGLLTFTHARHFKHMQRQTLPRVMALCSDAQPPCHGPCQPLRKAEHNRSAGRSRASTHTTLGQLPRRCRGMQAVSTAQLGHKTADKTS